MSASVAATAVAVQHGTSAYEIAESSGMPEERTSYSLSSATPAGTPTCARSATPQTTPANARDHRRYWREGQRECAYRPRRCGNVKVGRKSKSGEPQAEGARNSVAGA